MDEINRIYRYGCLFEGVYKDDRVIYDKKRSIINRLMHLVISIVFISQLLIFVTDNKFLKDHLIYFKVFDAFGSRFFNFSCCLIVFVMNYPLVIYLKFTKNPDKFKQFSFAFCLSENEMNEKYKLSKLRSKNQVKFQANYFKYAFALARYYSITFGILIIKTGYESTLKTSTNFNFLDYLINLIKIIFSLLFFLSFTSVSYRYFINLGEFLMCCKYLANRLDDKCDKIFNIFKNEKYLDKKYLNQKILKLSKEYNLILNDKKIFNKHFNRTLTSKLCVLLFTILHPSMVLFNHSADNNKLINCFYSINTFLVYLQFALFCYFNGIFIDSNQQFWKNLDLILKFTDLRSKIKILNIYSLNTDLHINSFNYRHLFTYTFNFLLFWALETVALLFLVYFASKIF